MSSSSSSSESEGDDYWNYETEHDRNFRNAFGRTPFYPTMGTPLLYYTQVPQPVSWKNRGRKRRRDSPNCFVKAFRWYTEEHVPTRTSTASQKAGRPNMSGFATWLDIKYDQFLQESRVSSEACHLKLKQTAIIETERTDRTIRGHRETPSLQGEMSPCDHECCKVFETVCEEQACSPKRHRIKSPWKRRQRAKSTDTKDYRQRSNHSFKYILQPKDMSRHGSICCHPSNATVTLDCQKKSVAKSQSFSNVTIVRSNETISEIKPVCGEVNRTATAVLETAAKKTSTKDFSCQYCEPTLPKADAGTQCDFREPSTSSCFTQPSVPNECQCQLLDARKIVANAVPSCGSAPIPEQCGCQSLDRMPRKTSKKLSATSSKRRLSKRPSKVNHECQCPEEKVVTVDVQTQYDKCCSRLPSASCGCNIQDLMRSCTPSSQCTSTTNLCSCERKIMGELLKQRVCVVKLAQKTAQTSNHSIYLDNRAVNNYPLFMKIICADKLSDENVKCSK